MNRIIKINSLTIIITLFLVIIMPVPINAHDRKAHDNDIEYVLFGNSNYKESHPLEMSKIQALEDATYLCVDQYNGMGKEALEHLKSEKIPNIPKSIDEIDFTGNYAHRKYTHRGWNVDYPTKVHWPARKEILFNTLDKELFSIAKTPVAWFPWLNDKIYGKNNYKKQCENMCILLYYTHIIGDHIEAEKYESLAYIAPLTNLNDINNPGIIPDLINSCDVLFEGQRNTYLYIEFKQELENLRDTSEMLTGSKGGVNTDDKFQEYHQCAIDLLEVLAMYVPQLLTNEAFFSQSFNL